MGTYKKLLKAYKISETIFNQIIYNRPISCKHVDNIQYYFYGYKGTDLEGQKLKIVYGEVGCTRYMVLLAATLYAYIPDWHSNSWKQIRLISDKETKSIEADYDPFTCFKKLNNIINKYYTQEEKDECYKKHMLSNEEHKKQVHINYQATFDNLIYKIKDCVKYDINGAHCDALCEIFPKCRNAFNRLYEKRKIEGNEWIKAMFNYSVGYLNSAKLKDKYGKVYYWIVNRTTEILEKAIKDVGGEVIYANTDGVCIQHPKKLIKTSKKLGEFKLEYKGDVYFVKTDNYMLYQFGKDKKGSCRIEVRNDIDLSKGIVVKYKNDHWTQTIIEKHKEILEIYEKS